MAHAILTQPAITRQAAVSLAVDTMTMADVPAVMMIERVSFPTPWPQQAYEYELQKNENACFVVVRAHPQSLSAESAHRHSRLRRLLGLKTSQADHEASVVGYAGMWMFVDEAHISTIASHPDWRGQGIGELLLLSEIRAAEKRDALFVTLEVRVSNRVAQNLYLKYGFDEVGRRKNYYRDNGEDALIMTVQRFRQPAYKAQLNELDRQLRARLAIMPTDG